MATGDVDAVANGIPHSEVKVIEVADSITSQPGAPVSSGGFCLPRDGEGEVEAKVTRLDNGARNRMKV